VQSTSITNQAYTCAAVSNLANSNAVCNPTCDPIAKDGTVNRLPVHIEVNIIVSLIHHNCSLMYCPHLNDLIIHHTSQSHVWWFSLKVACQTIVCTKVTDQSVVPANTWNRISSSRTHDSSQLICLHMLYC